MRRPGGRGHRFASPVDALPGPPAAASNSPSALQEPKENLLDSFDLNNNIKERLREKGIESLFPIQAACIPHALGGKDVVGRARTGCGKTLAFVLPTVELLMREKCRPSSGSANVICLLPTRELAKQVCLCATPGTPNYTGISVKLCIVSVCTHHHVQ